MNTLDHKWELLTPTRFTAAVAAAAALAAATYKGFDMWG